MSTKAHVVSMANPVLDLTTGHDAQIRLHQVPTAVDNLCWLIEYEPYKVALVDGPGAQEILRYLSKHNLQLTHILNTHTHGDHIGVNQELAKLNLLTDIQVWGSANAPKTIPGLTRSLSDHESITLGPLSGKVLLTEGHLNGHISFIFNLQPPALSPNQAQDHDVIETLLFCGDTLFAGGCGYVFDGPMSTMANSLDKLASLSPNTLVCCAHEYTLDNLHFALSIEPNNPKLQERVQKVIQRRKRGQSTVPSLLREELETNPFLRNMSQEILTKLGLESTSDRSLIFEKTRRLKDSKVYRETHLESLLKA